MATASPTPMAPGPVRRTSQRQLRRPPSRVAATRSETQAAAHAAAAAQAKPQQSQYEDDSSEDEIPVPMKLSALTKALLNDGPEEAGAQEQNASPPRTRRQAAAAAAPVRRSTRGGSAQPNDARDERPSSPNREPSPVRKRVVRLSNTPQSLNQMGSSSNRRSTSNSQQHASVPQRPHPPSRQDSVDKPEDVKEEEAEVNTPAQAGRVVRIAAGSSGNRSRIGSSGQSSGRSHFDRSIADRSAAEGEHDQSEAPDTAARNAASGSGSVSRYPSTRARDENVNPQSSMRIKRVGKLSGSFLSGPARRGRRRQSEEDVEAQAEAQADGGNPVQEQDAPTADEPRFASPHYADGRHDFNSGSPVGGSAARSAHRRHPSKMEIRADSARASPRLSEQPAPKEKKDPESRIGDIGHLVSVGRLQMPSANDQENDVPFNQKWAKNTTDEANKPNHQQPIKAEVIPPGKSSPDRKPLAAINGRNTPLRPAPPPPPKMSVLEAATSTTGAAATTGTKQRRNILKVNGKVYTRLDCLGRGGTSKVYRVMAENGTMMALKRVSLENADEATIKGYKGEIDLLEKLTGVDRVVNLFAHELNTEKQMLSLVMEMGERDLQGVMGQHQNPETTRLDPVFIRHYWKEMVECVQCVHQHDIVHTDLKPANFVLVKGRLKLIDFGIANAIQTDETINVHREAQVGTPNYMSPESLLDSNSPRGGRVPGRPKLMRIGKASDVWSLGCILYQMVYGVPPFGHIVNQMARCQAIINWNHNIEFPSRATGGFLVPPSLLRTMKRCLIRDPHMRPTCDELLHHSDPFLYPAEFGEKALPIDEELLGRVIQSVVTRCKERMPTEAESVNVWPQAYWASIRKAVVGRTA